jgi:plasmid stability protein
MANVTIRNVPEELHAALKERARRNRRSLNEEVLALLESACQAPPGPADELAVAIEAARERWRDSAGEQELPTSDDVAGWIRSGRA